MNGTTAPRDVRLDNLDMDVDVDGGVRDRAADDRTDTEQRRQGILLEMMLRRMLMME